MNHNIKKYNPYFYHSDHTSATLSAGLGSSSFISDRDGTAIQHLQYLPYGETFINQTSATLSYQSRYTFSGKEKDTETDYGYFGARYLMSDLSIWLSVDPMADKYPHLSAYNYCALNPIMLVDPDGREIEPGSQKEWDSQKKNIEVKRNEINAYELLNKKWGIKDKNNTDRLNKLNQTLDDMNTMEESTTMYSLDKNNSNKGETKMNKDESISLSFSTTALFVHEVTHGGQYESGEIGFVPCIGSIEDYQDELNAYKAQGAYDPESLPNMPAKMTFEWLLGIKFNGKSVYSGIGQYPINSNSGADACKKAFPKQNYDDFGKNETLNSYYYDKIKFKK